MRQKLMMRQPFKTRETCAVQLAAGRKQKMRRGLRTNLMTQSTNITHN